MGNLSKQVNRLLHAAIAACLMCMSSFVFINVILRYFFNEGLTWAEEASRYLFIWLIFLGAIVAYKENVHLGVDTLVVKLSVKNRRILFIINNIVLADYDGALRRRNLENYASHQRSDLFIHADTDVLGVRLGIHLLRGNGGHFAQQHLPVCLPTSWMNPNWSCRPIAKTKDSLIWQSAKMHGRSEKTMTMT